MKMGGSENSERYFVNVNLNMDHLNREIYYKTVKRYVRLMFQRITNDALM